MCIEIRLLTIAMFIVSGCGGCGGEDFRDCTPVDASAAEELPALLSQTGLYEDIATNTIAPGVLAFRPRYPLWTDKAEKHRWLLLPEGATVDTEREDAWTFPIGTKAFKDFVRDGVRVETRMVTRTAKGWTGAAYIWNERQTEARIALQGQQNALGTQHDVPNAQQCLACHGGRESFVLGFSAIQFDVEQRAEFFTQGLLSHESKSEPSLTPTAQEALGHMHGNCSHCHNAERNDQPHATSCFDPVSALPADFTLPIGLDKLAEAPACETASAELGTLGSSTVIDRMSVRNEDALTPSMPPLGTEIIDDVGIAKVKAMLRQWSEQP